MGIEKLKGSLLTEANEDARKIIETAEAHVRKMVEEERSKASAMKSGAEKEVDGLLNDQKNERLAWARLESKRILAEAREDAIKSVLEEFFDALKNVKKNPEYKKFLGRAVADAATELDSPVTVHVLKGDKSLIPALKNAKIVEDLESLGGALVETNDGKIIIDLTLETLFESKRDEIRKQVYDRLFGAK
ncbi:V-type ATP synthase subunit E [Candidatus Bilamarchaeum dharawalense]|uniref:A-type ATP synthase subunit E n=1 Tax=Candidatus Bilamarchaeum dharawalense TaxID=2885759 RepID=A0A5E4LMH8_9ARCH|nr:V-type ATP synthase subunit E [Candidatus Bilamarchaeum dharawalense]